MHSIILKRLRFSNLLSYGNTVNEVNFENGITWISGPNGSGKSTIIEALTLAWFNSPYRDINKPDLKNTANKSKTFTEVEFDRVDSKGTDRYVITRNMEKSGSTSTIITKNGDPDKKTASVNQKRIEEEILGFNKTLFENVISLNTIKTKPFIDMDAKDKRKLLESTLTLCIDKWKDRNKQEIKEAKTKFESAKSDVLKYGKDIQELSQIVNQIELERENDINSIINEVNNIDAEIVVLNDQYNDVSSLYTELYNNGISKKKELDVYADLDTKIASYNKLLVLIPQLNEEKAKYSIMESNIKLLSDEYTTKKSQYDLNNVRIKELNTLSTTTKSKITHNELELYKINSDIESCVSMMNAITTKANAVVSGVPCTTCGKLSTDDDVETIRSNYRTEWKEYNKTKTINTQRIDPIKKDIDTLKLVLTNINNELDSLNNENTVFMTYQIEQYNPVMSEYKSLLSSIASKEKVLKDLGVTDISVVEDELHKLSNDKQHKQSLESDIATIKSSILVQKEKKTSLESSITRLKHDKLSKELKIEEKRKLENNISLASTKKKLEDTEKDFVRANERVTKYSDEIAITSYIDGLCSDNGIKKIVLGIFVPNLNKAIATNLRLFGLPFNIEFDDSMDYKFTSGYGLSAVYEGLSEGQKRKINFAIAMAFRDFVSTIADFKINMLFLDEVLDISTDTEALRDMLLLLKSRCADIGGIYLITHRGYEVTDCFDHKIEVVNDGRYSSLKVGKLTSSNTNY